MTNLSIAPELYRTFAVLLDYPDRAQDKYIETFREAKLDNAVAALLQTFIDWYDSTPLPQREEIYSSLFDIDPRCTPLLSIHLYGEEDYRRGEFMVKLGELYEVYDHRFDGMLPDHIAVVIGLADKLKRDERSDYFRYCLITPLEKMLSLAPDSHPYRNLLEALLAVAKAEVTPEVTHA